MTNVTAAFVITGQQVFDNHPCHGPDHNAHPELTSIAAPLSKI